MDYDLNKAEEFEGTASQFFKLQEELNELKPLLAKVVDEVLKSGVSKYPILVIHQEKGIDLGIPVYSSVGTGNKWNVNISTLEDFYKKGLIKPEKVDDFRRLYKDPKDWFTLFVLSDLGAQFIFFDRSNANKN